MALGKPLIFGSDTQSKPNVIDIFLQASPNTLVGQISDPTITFPFDLATDVSGNLYVQNGLEAPVIPVFAPPYTNGPTRILQTGPYPSAVGVSSEGIVGVGSCSNENCVGSVVSFYAKGATTPCKTIPLATNLFPVSLSFDRAGDAFVAEYSSTLPYVAEIKGGCAAKQADSLTVKNKIGPVYDAHVNKQNEVALLDGNAGIIYTYKLPVKGSLGEPVSPTTTPDAFDFAFGLCPDKCVISTAAITL